MNGHSTALRDNCFIPLQLDVQLIVDDLLADDAGDIIIDGDREPAFETTWEEVAASEGLTIPQARHAARMASEHLIMRLYILDEVEYLNKLNSCDVFSDEEIDELVAGRLAHILENFGFEHLMRIVASRR